MKKILLLFVGASVCSFGQNNFVAKNHNNQTSLEFTTGSYRLNSQDNELAKGEYISAPEASFLLQKSAPEVMKFSASVEIANTGAPEVTLTGGLEYTDIPNISLLPSKGSLKRNVNPDEVPFTYGEAYTKNEFYPNKLVEVSKPFILRNKRGVTVITYPFQYNPVTKVLSV